MPTQRFLQLTEVFNLDSQIAALDAAADHPIPAESSAP